MLLARVKTMKEIFSRQDIASKWSGRICPQMDKRLTDGFNDARTWVLSEAGNDVYDHVLFDI